MVCNINQNSNDDIDILSECIYFNLLNQNNKKGEDFTIVNHLISTYHNFSSNYTRITTISTISKRAIITLLLSPSSTNCIHYTLNYLICLLIIH